MTREAAGEVGAPREGDDSPQGTGESVTGESGVDESGVDESAADESVADDAPRTGWRRWVTRRHIIQAVLLLGIAYVAIPFIGEAASASDSLRHGDWWWYLVAAAAVVLGCAAVFQSLMACAGTSAPIRQGLALQFAATFTGTATPASVGSLAISVRYLMKRGRSGPVATAAVGMQSIVTALVHLVLLALLVLFGSRSVDVMDSAPSGRVVRVVLAVALIVVAVVLGVPRLREAVKRIWEHQGRDILRNIVGLARSPHRLLVTILGAGAGTVSQAVALWAVLLGVGGGNHFVMAAFTTMVGATLATAAPTPGGIGAVEAALVGGLTVFGVEPGIAFVAAMGYRIIQTWIPVAVGWFCYRSLERSGAL